MTSLCLGFLIYKTWVARVPISQGCSEEQRSEHKQGLERCQAWSKSREGPLARRASAYIWKCDRHRVTELGCTWSWGAPGWQCRMEPELHSGSFPHLAQPPCRVTCSLRRQGESCYLSPHLSGAWGPKRDNISPQPSPASCLFGTSEPWAHFC